MLAVLNWAYIFGTSNSVFNFSNKSQRDSDDNLRKMKEQKDVLPIYMQHRYSLEVNELGELKQVKGIDNVRTMTNPVNGNRIDSKPSAATEEKADGIGRGNSAPIQSMTKLSLRNTLVRLLWRQVLPMYVPQKTLRRMVRCLVVSSSQLRVISIPNQ